MSDITQEQQEAMTALGYIVAGNTVIDENKNIVLDKPTRDGGFETDVPELQAIIDGKVSVEKVRARDSKGHYIADDPSTPDVNEAWTTKVVKKVTGKK